MDKGDFLGFMWSQLVTLGLPGLIIGLLLVALTVLWVAYIRERKRCAELTDRMFEMSRDTMTMIERISGR